MTNHANGDLVVDEGVVSEEKRQIGASMMEQLVPEITTHALSYLDYPSLCRLSMTNSSMRRAANDDNAWKALYHKDFSVEQDGISPVNGWKAYYAATKAVVDANAEFFSFIRSRSLAAMSRLWLHADYVKCIHSSGELLTGYAAVMESWAAALNRAPGGGGGQGAGVAFELREVRARVAGDVAWLTMKAYVDVDSVPFHVTNVFERHRGRWLIVHHHTSLMLPAHNNIFR
ncbi:F-box protein SKIP8-like isoform X2 [Wolffia australiana]